MFNIRKIQHHNFSNFCWGIYEFIKNDKPSKLDHVDQILNNIKENDLYQYPNLDPTFDNSRSHKQEISNFENTQKGISDLKWLRMKRLFEMLGTNSHFMKYL